MNTTVRLSFGVREWTFGGSYRVVVCTWQLSFTPSSRSWVIKLNGFNKNFSLSYRKRERKREQERIWDEKDQRKALWVNGGFGACLLIIAMKLSCSDNFSCRRRWFFALLVIDPCKGKLLWLHDCLQTVLAFQLPSSTSLMIVLDCLARYFVYCFPSTTRTPIRKTKGNKLNGSCRK